MVVSDKRRTGRMTSWAERWAGWWCSCSCWWCSGTGLNCWIIPASHRWILCADLFKGPVQPDPAWLDFDDGKQPFHCWTNGGQPSQTIETNGWGPECLQKVPWPWRLALTWKYVDYHLIDFAWYVCCSALIAHFKVICKDTSVPPFALPTSQCIQLQASINSCVQ